MAQVDISSGTPITTYPASTGAHEIGWGTNPDTGSTTFAWPTPATIVSPSIYTLISMNDAFELIENVIGVSFVGPFDFDGEVTETLIEFTFIDVASSPLDDMGSSPLPGPVPGGSNGADPLINAGHPLWDIDGSGGFAMGGFGYTALLTFTVRALGVQNMSSVSTVPGFVSYWTPGGAVGLGDGFASVTGIPRNADTITPNGTISPADQQGFLATPMALDIAALQALYGENAEHNGGSDGYILSADTGLTVDTLLSASGYECLWDTGGTDTILVAASVTQGVTIDLRAATLEDERGGGGWVSYIHGVDRGFTIAAGTVIEHAFGGSGDDILITNEEDNDLSGGAGADRFVFLGDGLDVDRVYDFETGLDILDVDDVLPGNPYDFLDEITFVIEGTTATITYDGQVLILEGIASWAEVRPADFFWT